MSKRFDIPVWKSAPFLRILPPLVIGILLQWYLEIPLPPILLGLVCFSISLLLFSFLPDAAQFKIFPLRGVIINLLWLAAGALLCWQKDIRHQHNWYGNYYTDSSYIIATINEPLVEKTKSYKADATVEAVVTNNTAAHCIGKLVLSVLQKNISSGKDELGISEALLIGYTNDLDKDLVQAYSNTGVVHIIAISGMHLGLIYVMLVFLFSKIPGINNSKWLQVLLILS